MKDNVSHAPYFGYGVEISENGLIISITDQRIIDLASSIKGPTTFREFIKCKNGYVENRVFVRTLLERPVIPLENV